MKFRKAVLIDIPDSSMDEEYWAKLDEVVDSRISLSSDSPELEGGGSRR